MSKVQTLNLDSTVLSTPLQTELPALQAHEAMLKAAFDEVAQLNPEAEFLLANKSTEEDDDSNYSDFDEPVDYISEDNMLHKPEELSLWLPSRDHDSVSEELCTVELELCKADAMQHLQGIRACIGEKSMLIQYLVRRNRDTGQDKRGRSWNEVGVVHKRLINNWAAYCRTYGAICRLPGSESVQETYLAIPKSQLADIKDITEANRYSQRNNTLPWFWTLHGESGTHSNVMKAGMLHQLLSELD